MKIEVKNKKPRFYLGDGQYITRAECPKCGKKLYTFSHKFVMFKECPDCGQELDWGHKIPSVSK